MKKLILLAMLLLVALVAAGFFASAADARTLLVEVGETPAAATEAQSHTLTLEGLEAGKGAFKVTTSSASYDVSLSKEQIKDLLAGTTIMAKTAGGTALAVKVSLVEGKEKEKGW